LGEVRKREGEEKKLSILQKIELNPKATSQGSAEMGRKKTLKKGGGVLLVAKRPHWLAIRGEKKKSRKGEKKEARPVRTSF